MRNYFFPALFLLFAFAACAPAPTPVVRPTTPTLRPQPTPTETTTPEPTPDARLQLVLWHALTGTQREAVNPLIDKFNASHPDIQLSAIPQGSDADLTRKLAASTNGSDSPDIVLAYPTDLALLNKSGLLTPLDDPKLYFSPDDLKEIFPAFVDRYPQFGNRVYSIGFARNLQVMYYNADMLKSAGVKLPETWDDFAKVCAAVIKTPDTLCFEMDPNALDFESAVLGRGGGLVTGDGKRVVFDQKAGLDALQWIADAFKNKYAVLTSRAFQQQSDFAAGKVAFTFDTTLALPLYSKNIANAGKNFGWSLAVPPRSVAPMVIAYGPSLAIVKRTPEKQQAALAFLKWLLGKDANSDWIIASNTFPARAETKDNLADYIKSNLPYVTAFNWLRFARAEPGIAGWGTIRGIIADAMVAAAGGKIAPADALKDAAAKAGVVLGQ